MIVNDLEEPMPSIRRCLAWGRLLRRAIESYPEPLRVAVLGTGGLSHSIGETTMGWIDEEFDHTCIKHFEDGEEARLAAFLTEALPRTGNGAHEIRDWVVAHAAAGSKGFELIDYFPSPETLVGRRLCLVEAELMARLAGRVAIVTGGAKGIGRHYSHALAAEGARVMIADIADGAELAEEIAARARRQFGDQRRHRRERRERGQGAGRRTPSSASARSTCWSTTPRCLRRCRKQKCTEIDVAIWDQVMAVNLRGPFLMVKHVVPHMIAQGYGKIINIGSGTAFRGIPLVPALRHVEGRHHGDDAGAVARARRSRHPRQHAGAGLHAQRHRDERESGPRAAPRASARCSRARSSATSIPRTCWARWCSSPPPTAISSPARPSRWTAAT